MIGYIKLHRQLLDSAHFNNVHEQMAFAWLLMRAQWQDVTVRYKGKSIDLKRGQLALSYRDFANTWGWSEAKCRRFIAKLSEVKPKSNRSQTDTTSDASGDAVLSASGDAGVNVITILNYNKFQDSDKKDDAPSDAPDDAPPDAPDDADATQGRRSSDAQNKEDNKLIIKQQQILDVAFLENSRECDLKKIDEWLKEGFDVEKDILPTITEVYRIQSARDNTPGSLAYYDTAVRNAKSKRLANGPFKPPTDPKTLSLEDWCKLIKFDMETESFISDFYRDHRKTNFPHGNPPTMPGCSAPVALQLAVLRCWGENIPEWLQDAAKRLEE